MTDLDELEKLAKEATPGPWHFHQDDGTALDISEVCIPRPEEDVDLSIASLLEDRDGAFIAAANPQVILELIERVRLVEAERGAALARIAELEQSLRSESLARGVDTTLLREYERRLAEAAKLHRPVEGIHGLLVCSHRHCVDDSQDQCAWPCETAIALGLNEGDER